MKRDTIIESEYETIKKEKTREIIILESFGDLFDKDFYRSLEKRKSVCVSHRGTSYIRLSKEFEKSITGRMKVDEVVLIRINDNFILKIYNSDVGDEFGSFGYTSVYFSEYKQPEILTLEAFCSRTNKFYRDSISPLDGGRTDDIRNFIN